MNVSIKFPDTILLKTTWKKHVWVNLPVAIVEDRQIVAKLKLQMLIRRSMLGERVEYIRGAY